MTQARRITVSIFVVLWTLLFHYESLRTFYLTPLFGRSLPKFPLLFPPAGWIMFYQVDPSWSTAEVYGLKPESEKPEWIDPHRIFTTDFIGFDNIHRNIMVNVLDPRVAPHFCPYLKRKFPEYVKFIIVHAVFPDLVSEKPPQKYYQPLYPC